MIVQNVLFNRLVKCDFILIDVSFCAEILHAMLVVPKPKELPIVRINKNTQINQGQSW